MMKATSKLRNSKLFDSVEDMASPICAIDLEGRLKFVNRALAELMGYSAREMLNRYFEDFLHPEDAARIKALFLNVVNPGDQPMEVEARAISKDGRVLHLFAKPSKILAEGKTVGFQAVLTSLSKIPAMSSWSTPRLVVSMRISFPASSTIREILEYMPSLVMTTWNLAMGYSDSSMVRDFQ